MYMYMYMYMYIYTYIYITPAVNSAVFEPLCALVAWQL